MHPELARKIAYVKREIASGRRDASDVAFLREVLRSLTREAGR